MKSRYCYLEDNNLLINVSCLFVAKVNEICKKNSDTYDKLHPFNEKTLNI